MRRDELGDQLRRTFRDLGWTIAMDRRPGQPLDPFDELAGVLLTSASGDPRLATGGGAIRTVLEDVRAELERALRTFAPLNSPHEGWAVIREELEPELWDHVVHNTGRSPEARHEAIQVAAMAVRYVLDLVDAEEPTR
jgi:hypothetical protein